MNSNFRPITNNEDSVDSIRIKGSVINLDLTAITGKDGDFIVAVMPTIDISGFGKNEKEALEHLEEEAKIFCEDLLSLKVAERKYYLKSLGFEQEKFHKKNYSKAYVDSDGALQGFEPGTVKRRSFQLV